MLKTSGIDKATVLYISKLITCVPVEQIASCKLCRKPYSDTIRHFVTDCFSTFILRDTFMNKVIDYYGVQPYLALSNLTEECLLQTLFKGKIEDYEFEEGTIAKEFTRNCAYLLRKAAQIYFCADT